MTNLATATTHLLLRFLVFGMLFNALLLFTVPARAAAEEGVWRYRYFKASSSHSQSEAYDRCRELNGYLATVINSEEQDQLKIDIGSNIQGSEEAWMAGTDRSNEGDWKWTYGRPTRQSVTLWKYSALLWVVRCKQDNCYWGRNQPDNFFGEDRMIIRSDYKWNDVDHNFKLSSWICEFFVTPTMTDTFTTTESSSRGTLSQFTISSSFTNSSTVIPTRTATATSTEPSHPTQPSGHSATNSDISPSTTDNSGSQITDSKETASMTPTILVTATETDTPTKTDSLTVTSTSTISASRSLSPMTNSISANNAAFSSSMPVLEKSSTTDFGITKSQAAHSSSVTQSLIQPTLVVSAGSGSRAAAAAGGRALTLELADLVKPQQLRSIQFNLTLNFATLDRSSTTTGEMSLIQDILAPTRPPDFVFGAAPSQGILGAPPKIAADTDALLGSLDSSPDDGSSSTGGDHPKPSSSVTIINVTRCLAVRPRESISQGQAQQQEQQIFQEIWDNRQLRQALWIVNQSTPGVSSHIELEFTTSSQHLLSSLVGRISSNLEFDLFFRDQCLKQRLNSTSLSLIVLCVPPEPKVRSPRDPELAKVLDGTEDVLRNLRSIPSVSMGNSRSGIILTLGQCEPQFYSQLGSSENPFRLTLGDPKYGQYTSAAIFNHVIILAVGGLHFLSAVIVSRVIKKKRVVRTTSSSDDQSGLVEGEDEVMDLAAATSYMRCPSLTIIPIIAFIEPTSTAAGVVIVYGEGIGLKMVGIISSLLCFAYPIGLFFYLRKTWVGVFIPGSRPQNCCSRKARRQRSEYSKRGRTAHSLNDDLLLESGGGDGSPDASTNTEESPPPSVITSIKEWFGFFLDGGVTWKDEDPIHHKGYVRRNRLLFMDYRGAFFWFLGIELLVAVLCGTLNGVKLGPGRCNGVIIALFIILLAFFILILAARPYNAPFLMLFSIVLTFIQLLAAFLMMISLLSSDEGIDEFEDWAEWLTLVAFYIIAWRAVFDLAPKVKQIVTHYLRLCGVTVKRQLHREKANNSSPNSNTKKPIRDRSKTINYDLTEQLLTTMREENVEAELDNIKATTTATEAAAPLRPLNLAEVDFAEGDGEEMLPMHNPLQENDEEQARGFQGFYEMDLPLPVADGESSLEMHYRVSPPGAMHHGGPSNESFGIASSSATSLGLRVGRTVVDRPDLYRARHNGGGGVYSGSEEDLLTNTSFNSQAARHLRANIRAGLRGISPQNSPRLSNNGSFSSYSFGANGARGVSPVAGRATSSRGQATQRSLMRSSIDAFLDELDRSPATTHHTLSSGAGPSHPNSRTAFPSTTVSLSSPEVSPRPTIVSAVHTNEKSPIAQELIDQL